MVPALLYAARPFTGQPKTVLARGRLAGRAQLRPVSVAFPGDPDLLRHGCDAVSPQNSATSPANHGNRAGVARPGLQPAIPSLKSRIDFTVAATPNGWRHGRPGEGPNRDTSQQMESDRARSAEVADPLGPLSPGADRIDCLGPSRGPVWPWSPRRSLACRRDRPDAKPSGTARSELRTRVLPFVPSTGQRTSKAGIRPTS